MKGETSVPSALAVLRFHPECVLRLCGPFEACVDLTAKYAEINRFCKKRFGAALQGITLVLRVPVRGDHYNRDIGASGLCPGQQLRPVIPGMLTSDRISMIEMPSASSMR